MTQPSPLNPDGIYIVDPRTKQEVFVPFDELHEACKEIMELPADMIEAQTGKMHYTQDPTYNLRRKK